jgi:hypothetical protein
MSKVPRVLAVAAGVAALAVPVAVFASRGGGHRVRLATGSGPTTSVEPAAAPDTPTSQPPATGPTTTATVLPAECRAGQLTATMSLDRSLYPWQQPVIMTLTLTNASDNPCTVKLATGVSRSPTYTITDNGGVAWTSTFCHHDAPASAHAVSEVWPPGKREVMHYTWSTNERRMYGGTPPKPFCSYSTPPDTDYPYGASAAWPGTHPYATSNQVAFHIDSGLAPTTSTSTPTTSTPTSSTSTTSTTES